MKYHTLKIEIPEEYEDQSFVELTIPPEATLDQCLQAFQGFFYDCGYRFPENLIISVKTHEEIE